MTAIAPSSNAVSVTDPTLGDRAIQLGNRMLDFIEKHPAVPVITVALGIFGSMGRTAIKAGWTPEQVVGLGKALPVQMSIPTLNL